MEFSLAFLAGALGALALPALPELWVAAVVLCAGIVAVGHRTRIRHWVAVCGFAAGLTLVWLHAYHYLNLRWSPERADDRVIARVVVDTLPVRRNGSWLFDGLATIERPTPSERELRVRVVWSNAPEQPHVGDRWQLLLTLQPPRARVNDGAPDGERMLFHDRVHALGEVINASVNRRIDSGLRPLDGLRERIAERIHEQVTDRDAAALIAALAVGATGEMSREQWRVFNTTGTTHLVAISGLHVTLFAVVAIAACRLLWTCALYRVVPWSRESFASAVGFAAAAGYATLSGLSVPTQRTLIMLGAWLLTRSLARTSTPFHTLALALVAVLIPDPFAPLAAGFWLSFGAMAVIILVDTAYVGQRSFISEAVAVQAAVTIALVPLTLAAFGSVSLVGPLVNVVTIPAMSWLLVPTVLLSIALAPFATVASNAVLTAAEWMHNTAWPWLAAAGDVPWALVHASPPWWWYPLAAVGALISALPLPFSLRAAVLVAVLPLAASVADLPPEGTVDITALDVGEGTAVIVQTADHVLVFDTGDAYGTDGRPVENVLLPVLRSRGVRRIDTLVLSALSPATAPGVTALFAEMPVGEVFVGGEGTHGGWPGASSVPCSAAPKWRWNGVRLRLLETSACVLIVDSGSHRAILAGDADRTVIDALGKEGHTSAEVVLVPRNGREASSSTDFIRTVGARWAVVSGRLARAGRGKPAVARWQEQGAEVLASGDLGAIRFRLGGSAGVQGPHSARVENRTLWRGSP